MAALPPLRKLCALSLGAFIFKLTLDQWRDWDGKLDWHLSVWSRVSLCAPA